MVGDRSRGKRKRSQGGQDSGEVNASATFSSSEAARALGLSPTTIRRAIASGELAASKQGANWRIRRNELLRYARLQNLPLPLAAQGRLVPLPAPMESAATLPHPGSTLIGRDTEVVRLTKLLADPAMSLVTLTGPGGIGKTRLALAAATAMQARLPDGAIFVDLSAVTRGEEMLLAIAQALGLRDVAGQERREQIAAFLRGKGLLLVLDNVEQISDAAPEIAQLPRLAGPTGRGRGTTVLVTSRAPLRVRGEQEIPVPPLPLAGHDASPDELLASDAGRLFVERARAHDPAFTVDAQSAAQIAQICARLNGLPLAIELAAARVKLLPPQQIRDRLEQMLPLLTSGERDAPPRHLTMRNAIAWSYDLLTPAEQRLFRQLAIFAGGFTLDAIEVIGSWGDGERTMNFVPRSPHHPIPLSPTSTLDHLDALLNQSMVGREVGSDGEPRFRLLETIRAYGLERLNTGEEANFRGLHARYFGELTQALRPVVVLESARAPLQRLAADDANLRAALTWLADSGSAAEFGAMVAALSGYWLAYSRLAEAEGWIEQAMARREQIPLPDRARLWIASAILTGFQGNTSQAELAYAAGIPLSRATGDPFDTAMALTTYGASRNQEGAYAAARTYLEEGRSVAATIADPRQRAAMLGRALANLSVTEREQGDFAAAKTLIEAALACYDGLGFDLAETRARMDLAGIAKDEGDLPTMVLHYQTCLTQTGEFGDMRVVYESLSGIASASTAWDQPRHAALLYGAAEAVRERVGLALSLPSDRASLARSLATLREALSEADFATSWDEGRSLPLAQAMAIAAAVSPSMAEPPLPPPAAALRLTRREQDVLRLLAAGETDRDIAVALFIGPRTVSWHVSAILGKLGVTTRREAASKAISDGLL